MNIEIGMYVRMYDWSYEGEEGLVLITKVNQAILDNANHPYLSSFFIKASHNIIDLIEVGDYVNGYQVWGVYREGVNSNLNNIEVSTGVFNEEDIKSIVTKEQFAKMEYTL